MLRLMIGRAGTGKTAAVMEEICEAVRLKQGGSWLIVPEQYSHEAERELCRRAGDSLSLYAEVFSFTGLARRMMSEQGGGADAMLDKGGRLLCMALAVKSVAPRLKLYAAAARRSELRSTLLDAVTELKTACVSPDRLLAAAEDCDGSLGDKLRDLALITEAYDAVVSNGHADPTDRLTLLAAQIGESRLGGGNRVYVDGFTDFTRQEQEVLLSLMKKGVELCVCLTMDGLNGTNEVFELSRRAAQGLLHAAEELGIRTAVEPMEESGGRSDALKYYTDNMFAWSDAAPTDGQGSVELWRTDSVLSDCELAAATAIGLVRDKGCRWRDISVTVRGFDDYRASLESTFRHYGVPLFTAKKDDLLSKPLPAMIGAAYELLRGGWDVDDVISYMRTGLAGLSTEECDELAAYLFKWQLRGSAWTRASDWHQHPDGFGKEYDDDTEERLRRINELRRRLSAPLLRFAESSAKADTAIKNCAALTALLDELQLADTLSARAETLRGNGRAALASEYEQLWDITVAALEQCAAILGDAPMDAEEFGKLFPLMLSQYEVGTIPVSLDRVSAGDLDRNRRRSVKYLIVLGASDRRLPKSEESGGVFSQDDRRRLMEADIDIGGGDGELWREFSLIYNSLAMPSEGLILSCPLTDTDGAELRPAFVFERAEKLFGLKPRYADVTTLRLSAPAPALSVAAAAFQREDARAQAVLDYFRAREPDKCAAMEQASRMTRGSLSPRAVEALYGKRLKLSASRIDTFASCRFAYFCQYGLKARPTRPASFQPPEIGSFLHTVLENTAREVKQRGGFARVPDEELKAIASSFVERYVHEELEDFREKSPRFTYLFRRLCEDVYRIVQDTADELRCSDFTPQEFELDFSRAEDFRPMELGEGQESLRLTGIADRVDGWLHDGKLYLRVVDYKTGKKKFSLSDVWYGMGLQMLLYLFALESGGKGHYGQEIVPAGVMYVPARAVTVSADSEPDDETLDAERAKALRRSGMVLDDPALIEAWEHGSEKRYIPIRTVYGKVSQETVASAERLGILRRHVEKTLGEMASQLRAGSIAADPFYRTQQENACVNCEYKSACHFTDGQNGESCRFTPKLSPDKVWKRMEGGEDDE